MSVRAVGRSLLSRAPLAATILALLAILATTSIGVATANAAVLNSAHPSATAAAVATSHQLKAVFIVGPTGSALQSQDLTDATNLANVAESYGMDVRRVFFPHATWANVLANIQGANLVVYMGHGYGWPSKYTTVLTESRQDGMGLNTYDGSGTNTYTYYGASVLRQYVKLAPNAIVFLNHLCYSAGNAEPGMAFPTWDIARQRVDNMASGWLAIGAKDVFAYGEQQFTKSLRALFDTTTNYSMDAIFRFPGPKPTEVWGWVGWDPRQFASVRTPGATNFMDPSLAEGWYRAVTGDLTMTAANWRAGPDPSGPPTLTNLSASTDGAAYLVGSNGTLFTPNGDGVTDALNLRYNVDKETFVNWQVQNSSGTVVRNFSSWSPTGPGTAVWDGKRDDGTYVGDGAYSLIATPSSRAGDMGGTSSVTVKVLTTMANPQASPTLFYAADRDGLAPNTTFSVTLTQPASLSWKIVDSNNNTVRTNMSNVALGAGNQTWTWDGKNDSSAYVPDGTYSSVMTAATAAGTYSQRVLVDVKAFRLTTSVPAPFVRGTKAKVFVYSAEPLSGKPKVKMFAPGLAVKTYGTYILAGGGYYVTVTFPATAQPGTVLLRVVGTDTGLMSQQTDYSFQLL